jgi:hypothetical protein
MDRGQYMYILVRGIPASETCYVNREHTNHSFAGDLIVLLAFEGLLTDYRVDRRFVLEPRLSDVHVSTQSQLHNIRQQDF